MGSAYVCGSKNLYNLIGPDQKKPIHCKAWYKLIHPKDRTRVKTNHQTAAINNQSNWEHEFRLKTNRGYIIVEEKGFIIYEKAEAVKMIGSLRDITELKILESKLIKEKAKQRKKIIRAKVVSQEKERVYLGNELHDNVNQLLVASKLFLETIKTADARSAEMKNNVGQYLLSACNEIRNLSHGLAGSNFDHNGLADSFKKILDDLALSGTFEITFNYDEKIEAISKSKKITLLRILQEQTKNIIKHSQATRIDIGLLIVNNKVQFYARDNGIGFDPRSLRRGIGLSNIYDRVKLYNGSAELNSSPGMGCEVKVTLPVKGK
jgi:signal transduction histidine kinase